MRVDSELHIVVPGICGPLAETHSIQQSSVLKHWVSCLAKAHRAKSSSSVYDVISSMLNFSIDGDFPSAALTLLGNDRYDASMHYMHADPVHLRAEMDHAVLTSYVDLAITEAESVQLCDALNKHFSEDALSFFRLDNNQWFVASMNKIEIETTPLVDSIGRNVNFLLPTGKAASRWKQILTEAQMLMHTNAINAERENKGQQIINSVWFYGSGQLPVSDNKITGICSNDDLYSGLSRHLNCRYINLPDEVSSYQESLLSRSGNAVNLLHLSELQNLTNYTDVTMWLEKLADVLDNWIYPLIKFCNKNNIKVSLYPCNGSKYQFEKYDSLKFWRHGKVEEYVTRY